MKTFSINIAKAYTQSDWRGLPAHMHHALITLDYGMSESEAAPIGLRVGLGDVD